MTNLTYYAIASDIISVVTDDKDQLELFKIKGTNEHGMSQSTTARICGVTLERFKIFLEQVDRKLISLEELEQYSNGRWKLVKWFDIVDTEAALEFQRYFAYNEFNSTAYMIHHNWAEEGLQKAFCRIEGKEYDRSKSHFITLEEAEKEVSILRLQKRESDARQIKSQIVKTGRSPQKPSLEKAIQLRLKKELGGQTEVSTPAGRIDLLTETELIEIKAADHWKDGIGQLLSYQTYYPNHVKRLHLFGECPSLASAKSVCSTHNIVLTRETILTESTINLIPIKYSQTEPVKTGKTKANTPAKVKQDKLLPLPDFIKEVTLDGVQYLTQSDLWINKIFAVGDRVISLMPGSAGEWGTVTEINKRSPEKFTPYDDLIVIWDSEERDCLYFNQIAKRG